jgi:predicted metal-dependent phosphoesterase TrpH
LSRIDLHLHSNASDGKFSPAEVVRKSAEAGLTVIALTDHDTVDGIESALKAGRSFSGLTVIPGVEINTDVPKGEAHVLGYFIDYNHPELLATLKRMRDARQERALGMIAKLRSLGMPLEWERVKKIAGTGAIGRPHIAQAMLEKGYITSLKEAFNKYIGFDGPAYVERTKVSPVEAVEIIVRANGLPVFAHPLTVQDPEAMVRQLKSKGLVGLEAYYNGYTQAQVSLLVGLAEKYGLIVTGGSDYHGLDESSETIIGGVDVPMKSVERLLALAGKRIPNSANR